MTYQAIIDSINRLINIHDELLIISKEKTEQIKAGNIEQFQALIMKERKYVQRLEKEEEKRKELVDTWFLTRRISREQASVTRMLEHTEHGDIKTLLEKKTILLAERLLALKQQEQLNKDLIQQSLQFVQLSLDLLMPSLQTMNYGKQQQQSVQSKQSMFDSKA